MLDWLTEFSLDSWEWMLLVLCGMLVGMSKVGVIAVYPLVIPIMALMFGGRASTGLLVPMLIAADVFAVSYYNRAADWKHVWRMVIPAFAGLLIGVWVGHVISDQIFTIVMGGIILGGIGLMLWMDARRDHYVPDSLWFSISMGMLAGFSTMVGNMAGPVTAVYLLSMRLPKNVFIGTGAWFYLIINLCKLPFHLWVWETISLQSTLLNGLMLPAIGLGAWVGVYVVKLFPEKAYRQFIIAVTVFSALLLFV